MITLAGMVGRCVIALAVLVPQLAHADAEQLRLGVDGTYVVGADRDGKAIGVSGEVPVRAVPLRVRVEYGTLDEQHDNYDLPPFAMGSFGDADCWRLTVGTESRNPLTGSGTLALFAGFSLGGMRLAGGFVETPEYRVYARGTLGVEIRVGQLRLRPAVSLATAVSVDSHVAERTIALPSIDLGAEYAF